MNPRSSPALSRSPVISIIRAPALLRLRQSRENQLGRDFRAEHPGLESHRRKDRGYFLGTGTRTRASLIGLKGRGSGASDRFWGLVGWAFSTPCLFRPHQPPLIDGQTPQAAARDGD